MAKIEDSIELESVDEFVKMLDTMCDPIRNPSITSAQWQEVIDVLQEMERGFFASSVGPTGEPWVPLSPVTEAKKGHGIILRETYELEASLIGFGPSAVRTSSSDSLEFGTSREWAWIHQKGSGKIPQREFIGFNQDGMDDVLSIVADAAVQMMFDAN